jgi:hypothetical protein
MLSRIHDSKLEASATHRPEALCLKLVVWQVSPDKLAGIAAYDYDI